MPNIPYHKHLTKHPTNSYYKLSDKKCTGTGLNGLIFKRIIKNWNIKEEKNAGNRLGFVC